jgi:hypothetical protein
MKECMVGYRYISDIAYYDGLAAGGSTLELKYTILLLTIDTISHKA